ncbi:alpha/beta fold hydrolase [Streptomyces sp. DH37]|uniref:thioesterase II family protein n=1 Tax=Streptomyces sp. DH37 TaxID=3040122 RepID=UPI002442F1F6|nr:alpha/beta fold hydrolase [Streptomyces sp. DH37]MDG9701517.1 alpha/beta fold hydrolase [Streptomyces sp. DH37]
MATKDPWIRELRRTERPAAHVVFFPQAGGAATFYIPFARHLPERFDVSAVQYPGRQERLGEPFVTTVEGMADRAASSLRRYADRTTPLVLFGHSMGASVAFETAVRLAAEGAPALRHLVVSGRSAPSVPLDDQVYRGTDQEILDHLVELGGTDAEIIRDPDLVALFMPAVRNDYRAVGLYRPLAHATVDVPVLCLTGDQDPRVTPEGAAAWKEHTSADFLLRTFPGGHFFLTEHREAVARLVSDCAGFPNGNPGPDLGG